MRGFQARKHRALLLALGIVLWTAACAGTGGARTSTSTSNDAVIKIDCDTADAELWVNDRFVVHLGGINSGIALSPGRHRIEVRHPNYHTYYRELSVMARQKLTLVIELAEILP